VGQAIRPPFVRRFTRLPVAGRTGTARNLDRLLNRFRDYPRHIRRAAVGFDAFHLVDHSYSQLLMELPEGRAGIYCHDLDTFRCVLEPDRDRRPWWFRAMTRRALDGFRRAAVVFHSTRAVGEDIIRFGLADAGRLVHAPYGPAPEFTPEPVGDEVGGTSRPFLLHVGSCIPRKRMDVLLSVFAEVRRAQPELQLVQVGGVWTETQRMQLARLGLSAAVRQRRGLSRSELAALYRSATLVLQPSEAEGFGLPVLEALACGAAVVASDIPTLREVGGDAVTYCPVGDVGAWSAEVLRLVERPSSCPPRADRLARAALFSWDAHAQTIWNAYRRLMVP
jgi:glycosyltransferase involved in cell wall biosynthesis